MEFEGLSLENVKYSLFAKRRFLPMFLATFLGTLNDNLVRSGIIVLIAYAGIHGISLPAQPEILVTICSALLVLPMVLFSSVAGQLADKWEKSHLIIYTKIAEIFIMLGVAYGFSTHNILLLMGLLFCSGTHTTFYVPVKYSILPQHLQRGELLAGNGFMAGGSYVGVLLGMIVGGLLVEEPHNIIGYAAIGIALIGFVASLLIPRAPSSHPHTKVNMNLWQGSKDIIAYVLREPHLPRVIFSLSWFLLVGGVFISQFANYAQGTVRADNQVYILFLTIFSLGVAGGSILCDTLLKGEISARFTARAGLGISLFIFIMVWATPAPLHEGLMTIGQFLEAEQNWLVLGSMLGIAVCGGLYMVPLYALLQHRADAEYRSRIIAASNLSDSLCMVVAASVAAVLLYAGLAVTDLFLVVATCNLGVAWYARKISV